MAAVSARNVVEPKDTNCTGDDDSNKLSEIEGEEEEEVSCSVVCSSSSTCTIWLLSFSFCCDCTSLENVSNSPGLCIARKGTNSGKK